jgi:hypothetical protein
MLSFVISTSYKFVTAFESFKIYPGAIFYHGEYAIFEKYVSIVGGVVGFQTIKTNLTSFKNRDANIKTMEKNMSNFVTHGHMIQVRFIFKRKIRFKRN